MSALPQVLLREGKEPSAPTKVEHRCGSKPSQKGNGAVSDDFFGGDHDDLCLQKTNMPQVRCTGGAGRVVVVDGDECGSGIGPVCSLEPRATTIVEELGRVKGDPASVSRAVMARITPRSAAKLHSGDASSAASCCSPAAIQTLCARFPRRAPAPMNLVRVYPLLRLDRFVGVAVGVGMSRDGGM